MEPTVSKLVRKRAVRNVVRTETVNFFAHHCFNPISPSARVSGYSTTLSRPVRFHVWQMAIYEIHGETSIKISHRAYMSDKDAKCLSAIELALMPLAVTEPAAPHPPIHACIHCGECFPTRLVKYQHACGMRPPAVERVPKASYEDVTSGDGEPGYRYVRPERKS